MSDQMISQEEIDALLKGDGGDLGGFSDGGDDSQPPIDDDLNMEMPSDDDFNNESSGAGGGSGDGGIFKDILSASEKENLLSFTEQYIVSNLNVIETILELNVQVLSKKLEFLSASELVAQRNFWGTSVEFNDGIWGKIYFIIDQDLAREISKVMAGEEELSDEELREKGFLEIMTQVFAASLPQMQSFFSVMVQGTIVSNFSTNTNDEISAESPQVYVAFFDINIQNVGNGTFAVVYPWNFINENKAFFQTEEGKTTNELLEEEQLLDEEIDENELEKVIGELSQKQGLSMEDIGSLDSMLSSSTSSPQSSSSSVQDIDVNSLENSVINQTASTPTGQSVPEMGAGGTGGMAQAPATGRSNLQQKFSNATIQNLEFSEIGTTSPPPSPTMPANIELLLDVPLKVTVELGRTKKKIREILELGVGSVVELEKQAGESVDLLVNDNLIARGEVVVIDENFGIRITSIVSPQERLERLK